MELSLGRSPFVTDGPVDYAHTIGRTNELATLKEWATGGGNVALVSPRRFGKTTLLQRLADDADPDELLVVIADMYEVASTADIVIRLEQAWNRARPSGLLSKAGDVLRMMGVGVTIGGVGFQFRLADQPDTDPLAAFHTLLQLPERVAGDGKRVVMVLDEFQSVGNVEGAEGLLRTYAQQQRECVSYVFAGSEPSMMRRAFSDQARPFYAQVEIFELGRLPLSLLSAAIVDGFRETERECIEVGARLVEQMEGHPQRTMLAAHRLWQEVERGGAADGEDLAVAVARVVESVEPEARAILGGLSSAQTRALRATAEFGYFTHSPALSLFGLSRHSARTAGQALAARCLIERVGDRWRVTDPVLGMWLRQAYGMRPPRSGYGALEGEH